MKVVTKLSVIFSILATDVEDLVERLRTVVAANVRAKEISRTMGADTFTRWSEQVWPNTLSFGVRLYSGLHITERHEVVLNLLLLSVPGPPFALYLAGAHVVGTYAFRPITDGAGLNVTVISTGDHVSFSIVACSDLMPGVWDLADAIPGALDELTTAAKRLPSGASRRARRSRIA